MLWGEWVTYHGLLCKTYYRLDVEYFAKYYKYYTKCRYLFFKVESSRNLCVVHVWWIYRRYYSKETYDECLAGLHCYGYVLSWNNNTQLLLLYSNMTHAVPPIPDNIYKTMLNTWWPMWNKIDPIIIFAQLFASDGTSMYWPAGDEYLIYVDSVAWGMGGHASSTSNERDHWTLV